MVSMYEIQRSGSITTEVYKNPYGSGNDIIRMNKYDYYFDPTDEQKNSSIQNIIFNSSSPKKVIIDKVIFHNYGLYS